MATTESPARMISLGRFAAYVAVLCAIVAIFLLCWFLREVLLLAFGAIILAVLIRALALPIASRSRLGERWAVLFVVVVLAFAAFGTFWLFGQQVTAQLSGLSERLPRATLEVRNWLESHGAGRFVLEHVRGGMPDEALLENAPRFFAIGLSTVGQIFLMLFTGIYLAASPKLYRDGFVVLFPEHLRVRLRAALLEGGISLRKWLLGQLVSMVSVGTLTGLGLWAVGAPLPLALGIVAGLLEFIPIIGPVIAFVPSVLVAFTEGPEVALSAAIVLIIVQQIEGSIIMPFAQRWAVALPPAYGLVAVVAFGLMFGFLGIFLGSPLAVVVMCLVQQLYVKEGGRKNGRNRGPPG